MDHDNEFPEKILKSTNRTFLGVLGSSWAFYKVSVIILAISIEQSSLFVSCF